MAFQRCHSRLVLSERPPPAVAAGCRAFLVSCAVFSLLLFPPGAAHAEYHSLFVGINDYDPTFADPANGLAGSILDASHMRALATSRGVFPASTAQLLTNAIATTNAIRGALRDLAATFSPADTLFYYHSSHGGYDTNLDLSSPDAHYLYAYDSRYTAADLAADLALFPPGARIVILLDACFSAGLFTYAPAIAKGSATSPGDSPATAFAAATFAALFSSSARKADASASVPDVAFITSASPYGYAFDSDAGGVFTQAFMFSVTNGNADSRLYGNSDGTVSFLEAFNYVSSFAAVRPVQVQAPDSATNYYTRPQALNPELLAAVPLGYAGPLPPPSSVHAWSDALSAAWPAALTVQSAPPYHLQLATSPLFYEASVAGPYAISNPAIAPLSPPFGWHYDFALTARKYLPLLTPAESVTFPPLDFSAYTSIVVSVEARTFGGATTASKKLVLSVSLDDGLSFVPVATNAPTTNSFKHLDYPATSLCGHPSAILRFSCPGAIPGAKPDSSKGVGIRHIVLSAFATNRPSSIVYELDTSAAPPVFLATNLPASTTYYLRLRHGTANATSPGRYSSPFALATTPPPPADLFLSATYTPPRPASATSPAIPATLDYTPSSTNLPYATTLQYTTNLLSPTSWTVPPDPIPPTPPFFLRLHLPRGP